MQKFFKGILRRWEVIFEYIGIGRLVEEIFKVIKIVFFQKLDIFKVFDLFFEKRKFVVFILFLFSIREEIFSVLSVNVFGVVSGFDLDFVNVFLSSSSEK